MHDVVARVVRHGKEALLFKVDIKHAFRNLPVHPSFWPSLGRVAIDLICGYNLPFDLHSAPAISNKLGDAVCWVLRSTYDMPT